MTIGKIFDNYVTIDMSVIPTGGENVRQIVDMLVSAGWTVESSGDGASTWGVGDVIGASPLNTTFWYRVSNPDGPEFLFFKYSSSALRFFYSHNDGFTGGSPSATVPPTATDQYQVDQNTGYISTDVNDRCVGFAETVSPYRFWTAYLDDSAANDRPKGFIVYDALNAVSADPIPFAIWRTGGNLNTNSGVAFLDDGTTSGWVSMVMETNTGITGQGFTAYAPTRGISPAFCSRSAASVDPDGAKGFSSLLTYTSSSGLTISGLSKGTDQNGDEFLYLGGFGMWLPWIGPLPTGYVFADNFDLHLWLPQGFTGGSVAVADTPPTITNLSPADGSALSPDDAISFDVNDIDNAVQKVLIWADFEGQSGTELIYDGDSFMSGFSNSTITDVNGDQTLMRFSLKKVGGWVYNVSRLRVRAIDGLGAIDIE